VGGNNNHLNWGISSRIFGENAERCAMKINVLLVEDEAVSALAMDLTLKAMGYTTCRSAASGKKALEILLLEKPDVVLMDINLTGHLDGIEIARKMQELGHTAIIFMTGYSADDVLDRARELNPAAILVKPINPNQLKAAIDAAVKNNRIL